MRASPPEAGDATDAPRPRRSFTRAAEHVLFGVGSGIAGTVYGTVVVMATLTAAYSRERDPWRLAVIVAATALVLWIAHVYSHSLSESIVQNRRLSGAELRSVLRRELGILAAAVCPFAALALGAIGIFRETTAVWVALGVGLVTLAAEGVRFARLERLRLAGTFAAMAINLALGLLVVAMKVALAH